MLNEFERPLLLALALSLGAAACGTPKLPASGASAAAPAKAPAGVLAELRRAIEGGRRDDADALASSLPEPARKSNEGRVLLGRLAELHGGGSEAKDAYAAVLADSPGHLEASLALGARLLEEGDVRGALAVTDAGLAVNPNDGSLLLNRAYVVLASDGFPKAAEAFALAEQASGGASVVRLSFASALSRAGRGAEAIPVLVRVAGDARSSLGEVAEAGHELRQQGAFVQALAAFDRVVASKDTGEIRVERALCKLGARDAEGSMKELELGLKVEPNYAPLHFYKAGRLAEGKRWREAKASYERYLELAPEGPLADLAKKRIRMVSVHLEK